MSSENIKTSLEAGVLEIRIDRAETKNSLLVSMYQDMMDVFLSAADDDAVKVVVIRGVEGDFTSGNDLRDFLETPPTGPESTVFRFMHVMAAFEKPIIAAVEGVAVGLGSTMLLHCDLVYAAPDTKFIMPFVPLALVPEAAASLLMPKVGGHRLASELLLFGEPFGVDEAKQIGLISRVVDAVDLHAHVAKRAKKLTKLPPRAVLETKKILKGHQREEVEAAIDLEARAFCQLLVSAECKEAINAFFEKRKPDFSKLA